MLDTKWKRLDESRGGSLDKYGLSQADFYQLFVYGQRYLEGQGTMLLVYPKTSAFQAPLGEFAFDDKLRLVVVPFDLEQGCFAGDIAPWWSMKGVARTPLKQALWTSVGPTKREHLRQ